MDKLLNNKKILNLMDNTDENYLPDLKKDKIIYFPVRHHSPIVSFQLTKLINEYNPEIILIEGPSNINDIKEKLFTTNAKMPLAFYSILNQEVEVEDEDGKIKKETLRDAVYYPFAEFSPEYIAIKIGLEKNIKTEFIDLHYINLKEYYTNYEQIVNDNYIAYSGYISLLIEKLGLENFNELWENYFETGYHNESPQKFITDFYSFCYFSRKTYKIETLINEGNIAREIYMASKILKYSENFDKILVVTGGFHTPSLIKLVENNKELKFNLKTKGEIENYVIPYSYNRIDERSGYKSGIIFPSYHNELLKKLQAFNDNSDFKSPYEETIINFLHKLHKELRKSGESGTIVNKIEAIRIMDELKFLRDKKSVTTKEMIDAIISSYAKGNDNIKNILTSLNKVLTGKKRGFYPYTKEDSPILMDFHNNLQKNRLDIVNEIKRIDIYPTKSKSQKNKSILLHKLIFLDILFANLIVKNYKQLGNYSNNSNVYSSNEGKGNFLNDENTYLAELWEYSLKLETYETIIEASLYGATINEAVLNKFEKLWETTSSFQHAVSLYINMLKLEIKLNQTQKFIELRNILENDMILSSLTNGFISLHNFMKVENLSNNHRFNEIYENTFDKIMKLLYFVDELSTEEEEEFSNNLKTIYSVITNNNESLEEFLEVINSLKLKLYDNIQVLGSIDGILYNTKQLTEDDILITFTQIINGINNGENIAKYLKGVFMLSREIFILNNQFIEKLNNFFTTITEDEFLEIIPNLKQVFTFFSPTEQGKIAKNIAYTLNISDDFIENINKNILPEEEIIGRKLDNAVLDFINKSKLIEL